MPLLITAVSGSARRLDKSREKIGAGRTAQVSRVRLRNRGEYKPRETERRLSARTQYPRNVHSARQRKVPVGRSRGRHAGNFDFFFFSVPQKLLHKRIIIFYIDGHFFCEHA